MHYYRDEKERTKLALTTNHFLTIDSWPQNRNEVGHTKFSNRMNGDGCLVHKKNSGMFPPNRPMLHATYTSKAFPRWTVLHALLVWSAKITWKHVWHRSFNHNITLQAIHFISRKYETLWTSLYRHLYPSSIFYYFSARRASANSRRKPQRTISSKYFSCFQTRR